MLQRYCWVTPTTERLELHAVRKSCCEAAAKLWVTGEELLRDCCKTVGDGLKGFC